MLVRVYADETGASHCEDLDELDQAWAISRLPDAAILALDGLADWDGRWRVSPAPQLVVIASGHVRLEVSDGESRRLGPGDSVIAEDTAGDGHRVTAEGPDQLVAQVFILTRSPGDEPRRD